MSSAPLYCSADGHDVSEMKSYKYNLYYSAERHDVKLSSALTTVV